MEKMNLNEIFQSVRAASRKLAMWDVETVNALLCAVADKIEEQTDSLLEANREDLLRMEVSNPKYDRLKLTKERLSGIAADMRQVAALPSPLGRVLESYTVPSGLRLIWSVYCRSSASASAAASSLSRYDVLSLLQISRVSAIFFAKPNLTSNSAS